MSETREIVVAAKKAYDAAMRQLAIPTNPNASFTEKMQASEPGFVQGVAIAAEAAKMRAQAAMDTLNEYVTTLSQDVLNGIPMSEWNGPTGDAGPVPQTGPGQRPTGTGPGGPGGGPSDLGDTGDQTGEQAEQAGAGDEAGAGGQPAGGDPAGGGTPTEGEGPGLAGLPPGTTTPTPTTPTYPTGPGGVGKLPTPSLPPVIPGGIPLQPLTTTTPKNPKGFKVGSGLGGSGLGGSGLGGSGLSGRGGGGSGLGGLDVGKGIGDGKDVPGQAARQMPSRALSATPQAPVPPAATPAVGANAPGAGGTPPPMMPPMGMGGGGESPKPGTAKPVVQNKGRTTNRLPGVPPKLRGRSGKADPTSGLGAFGAAASATRRRSERTEPLDTVQLLDEELWAVESKPESSTATPTRWKGFSSR
ncbi:hypothetical protein [Kribbella caucasensis]|uniref:hypothetical protein n=1 Tax=Kribbella caucasensis TaxID=2512215 RepID=UPI00105EAD78|nr:hypothetical protein [Kribbella sp. VKM Ac-2527]